ncbi:MAG TPA: hypothetical protein VGB26_12975 [Nitrospiria bacterium]
MVKLLGEILVDSGRLSEDQLSQALNRQVDQGGRLGTNLIELGFLSPTNWRNF